MINNNDCGFISTTSLIFDPIDSVMIRSMKCDNDEELLQVSILMPHIFEMSIKLRPSNSLRVIISVLQGVNRLCNERNNASSRQEASEAISTGAIEMNM